MKSNNILFVQPFLQAVFTYDFPYVHGTSPKPLKEDMKKT